jgi:hypothetical protein
MTDSQIFCLRMWGCGIVGLERLKVVMCIFVHGRCAGLQVFIVFFCILLFYVRLNHDVFLMAAWLALCLAHVHQSHLTSYRPELPSYRSYCTSCGHIRDPALERGGWSASRFRRITPGRVPVPPVQEAGCASVPIGMAREISPPLGFNPRTPGPYRNAVRTAVSRPPRSASFSETFPEASCSVLRAADMFRFL